MPDGEGEGEAGYAKTIFFFFMEVLENDWEFCQNVGPKTGEKRGLITLQGGG